jgi:hemoglobin/transferrin/lactoferrin receptor protein
MCVRVSSTSSRSHLRPVIMPLALLTLCGMGSKVGPLLASDVAIDHSISTTHPAASGADSLRGGAPDGEDSTSARPAPSLRSGAPARAVFPKGMADTVTVLPPVLVPGSRTAGGDRETATRVRLDRGAANRFLPQTVGDALASVPGVELVKTGAWAGQLSIRGLTGDRVLLMVDGVRMNTVRGHGIQSSLVALDRVDAVEVLPGAASAQFGTDALGGVVNIVTHRSLFADRAATSVAVGADVAEPGGARSQTAKVRVTGPRGGFEATGGFGAVDYLETPDGRVPDSGDREDHYAMRGALGVRNATIDFEHTHHAARDVGLPGFTGGAVIAGSYPLQGREAQRLELTVKGNGALPDFRVLGVRQDLRTYFAETAAESVFFRGRFVGTRTRDKRDRVTTEMHHVEPSLRFRGWGNLKLFGEYRWESASGPLAEDLIVRDAQGEVSSSSTTITASVPPADRDGWALGAHATQIVRGFKLEATLRQDALHSTADTLAGKNDTPLDVTDRRFSWSAGVARPIGTVEPYAHLSTGFRAPNLDERFYDNTVHGGLRVFGNPDLVSERSRSYELGLRASGNAPEWLRAARISVYRSDVDDLISLRYIGQLFLVPRFEYYNIDRARLEGVEANVRVRAANFDVAVSGTVPRGENRNTGSRLVNIGTTRASVEIVAPIRRVLPYGNASARWRWSDAIADVNPALARPAFSTTSVQVDGVLGGARVAFAVNNLWNHRHREPLSFIDEPGRTFVVSMSRELGGRWPFSGS